MKFTERQLRDAAPVQWLDEVLSKARKAHAGPWAAEELMSTANSLGSTFSMENLLRRLTPKPAAYDDAETLTLGELKKALGDVQDLTQRIAHDVAAEIMNHVMDHREPQYPEGTMVRDADGEYWQKTHPSGWLAFGVELPYPDDEPKRPLEEI
jgi:hypothetical protein